MYVYKGFATITTAAIPTTKSVVITISDDDEEVASHAPFCGTVVSSKQTSRKKLVWTIDAFSLAIILTTFGCKFCSITTIVAQVFILSCLRPLLMSILGKNGT